ncbi:MAG: AAA family ATPase [Methanobacterium sp.]|nr:AAA family ATPase [Methanobacterium sp.]
MNKTPIRQMVNKIFNNEEWSMKVLGVTGMPGSGKGLVAGVARKLGFKVIRMGDVIREEAEKREAPVGETAIRLRKEYGDFVVARRCIDKIKTLERIKSKSDQNTKSGLYMIEGIRSPMEVEMFRENFRNFKVISVNSTPVTRFKRLINRQRSDDSKQKTDFQKRDNRELKFGIGEVIATSDYMVVNEGSKKKFKSIIRSILTNELSNNG